MENYKMGNLLVCLSLANPIMLKPSGAPLQCPTLRKDTYPSSETSDLVDSVTNKLNLNRTESQTEKFFEGILMIVKLLG